jgi:osmotically-inducible protein OsmY
MEGGRIGRVAAIALLVGATALSGCGPLLVGGAVGGVGLAASERRGIGGYVDDTGIRMAINDLWLKHSVGLHHRMNLTVDQGRAMITGRAKSAQERLDAVRLASQANGVKEVINEIQVGEDTGVGDTANDTWISTQVRSGLVFEKSVSSQNFSVTTSAGVVYLLGTAKSREEMERAITVARSTAGVRQVVNHIAVQPS